MKLVRHKPSPAKKLPEFVSSAFQLYSLKSNLKVPWRELGALNMYQHFLKEYMIDDLSIILKTLNSKRQQLNNAGQLQETTGDLIKQPFWTWCS